MRRFFTFTLFFFCLNFAAVLSAQDENETQELDQEIKYDISVTADRLEESLKDKTDSITIITRDEIERQQWRYVTDALREVPGLAVVQSGSPGKTTSLFLRGGSSDQVLVLIDGVQINDPFFGGVDIEDITTDNIERVEIVRGPQSPLYGSDAIAGVINIITRTSSRETQMNASFEGGTFETFREKAGVSGSKEKATYALTYSRQDSKGQFDNDEFRQNNVSATGGYAFSNTTELSVNARVHDSHIGIPFSFADTPSPFRNQDTQMTVIGTSLQHSSGDYLNLKGRFSFTHLDFLFEDPEDAFSTLSKHTSRTFQAGLQNDFQLSGTDTLTIGYEFEQQGIDASDAAGPIPDLDDFDTTVNAIYAQNKWESEKWIFTTGFRFDHHSTFGSTVNPRISVAYRPRPDWKIRGGFGTGFRAPTAGDLAFPFFGNPDLDPEKSKSWEFGIDHYWTEHAVFSASYFRNDYEDLISFDPNTFIAGNIAKAKSQGLELSQSADYGNWHFVASYTFLDTEDEIEKHQLFRRPRHTGSARIAYETTQWGTSLRILGVGKRLETDFSTFPSQNVFNPGYVKVDLAGFYRLNSWLKLRGRIENLLDDAYSEALTFPAPGIAGYGGVELGF
ncbi:TonB-dependent receptor [bacterium]|nr:TonB-dependent receptor [bacterium]